MSGKLLVMCSLVTCRSVSLIKLKNSKKVYKQLFSKERNYRIKVTWSGKKVKSEKTLKVKHGILFVGKLKTIEHAIRFSLLFIYYLLFYLGS